MKKFFVVVSMLFALGATAFAAKDWKGKVLDENGEPMPYVTVAILNQADSTVIAGSVTEDDGSFALTTDAKSGILMVSILGYETQYFEPSQDILVRLVPSGMFLESASVSAVLPKVKLTGEGLQTAVKGTVLENIGSAKDALSRVPGIIRTQDGLQVLGKGAPLIYINGRKVTDISELDRLQSYEIQNIEVITNPGAQYSASVGAVVRIKTARRQGEGFGFDTGAHFEQSLRVKTNSDPTGYLNANYRYKNLDVFAGVNAYTYHMNQDSFIREETLFTPSFLQYGDLSLNHVERGMSSFGGLNWQVGDNHFLGFRLEHSHNFSTHEHQTIATENYKDGALVDKILSKGENGTDPDANNPSSLRLNAYYNGQAGKLGIDFNADYFTSNGNGHNLTDEKSDFNPDNMVETLNHNYNNMYAAKLVLTYPIWQGQLSLGTEETFTRRNEDYSIKGAPLPSTKSNLKENDYAGFVSYAFAAQGFGQLNVGVRFEHVDYDYNESIQKDNLSRTYNNWFPSLSYANQFGPVQVMFNYRAKTDRPSFSNLDGAMRYHSHYIYQSGNPKLQPQNSHEFGLTANWNFLTLVGQYARVDNLITIWSDMYGTEGAVLSRPTNLNNPFRQLAVYINATPTIGVWTLNYTAGVMKQWLSIDYVEALTGKSKSVEFNDKPMWIVQANNTFNFNGGWQIEAGAEYHSPGYSQNMELQNHFLNVTAAIQKTFLPDASLVVRLEGTDLARMARYNVATNLGNHKIMQTNLLDEQRIILRVTYRFNAANNKYKGTGAGQDVKARF